MEDWRNELKQLMLSEHDVEKLEQKINAAGEAHVDAGFTIPSNSQCRLTTTQFEHLLSLSNIAYDAMEWPTFLKHSSVLVYSGVNWLDYLYGRQALAASSAIAASANAALYVYNRAQKSLEMSPSEGAGYQAMALLKLGVSQPNQALKWLRLATLCPRYHKMAQESIDYKIKLCIDRCTNPNKWSF
jgi:predicted metal-dependent phosphoesterase TrpH